MGGVSDGCVHESFAGSPRAWGDLGENREVCHQQAANGSQWHLGLVISSDKLPSSLQSISEGLVVPEMPGDSRMLRMCAMASFNLAPARPAPVKCFRSLGSIFWRQAVFVVAGWLLWPKGACNSKSQVASRSCELIIGCGVFKFAEGSWNP